MPRVFKSLVLEVLLLVMVLAPRAHAMEYYFEIGGGLSQISNAPAFFEGSDPNAPSTLGLGLAAAFTFAFNLSPDDAPAMFQLGVQQRMSTGSNGATSDSLQASYPILRVQFGETFVTLGATPFIWQRSRQGFGFDYYSRSDSHLQVLGEVGYLFEVTPYVHFGLAAASQFVSVHGSFSTSPLLEGEALIRFRYGTPIQSSGSDSDEGNYRGWRYPYGEELN